MSKMFNSVNDICADDREAYFAALRELGQFIQCLNTNNLADISLSAYGFCAVVHWSHLNADI